MVARRASKSFGMVGWPLFAAGTDAPVAGRLSEDELAIGFVGILFVALLGSLLLAAIVIGARNVRRLNRAPPPRPSKMASDRWYEKPLGESAVEPHRETPDVE